MHVGVADVTDISLSKARVITSPSANSIPEVSNVRSIAPVSVTIAPAAAVISGFVIVATAVQELDPAKEYSFAAHGMHVSVPPTA